VRGFAVHRGSSSAIWVDNSDNMLRVWSESHGARGLESDPIPRTRTLAMLEEG